MSAQECRLIRCTLDDHGDSILAILNEAILNSTAIYDYQPRTRDSMVAWFAAKEAGQYPILGLETTDGTLAGFASYGMFRAWPAYKYSVEHSIYVHKGHRGQGLGRRLLTSLIEAAREQDKHVLVGGIDLENRPSIALHESMGFKRAGIIRQAGFKFERWLDLAFYQLVLDTPTQPREG